MCHGLQPCDGALARHWVPKAIGFSFISTYGCIVRYVKYRYDTRYNEGFIYQVQLLQWHRSKAQGGLTVLLGRHVEKAPTS